jgi:hypothetical protein
MRESHHSFMNLERLIILYELREIDYFENLKFYADIIKGRTPL